MNQFFMSNPVIRTTINVLFPTAMRNHLSQFFRSLWGYICLAQIHIYFAVDAIPYARWLCPVFELMDAFTRAVCWCIAYVVKIEVWFLLNMARLYGKLLRYAIYLFYGYSILLALANMDFSANIPLLEMILQNTEWLYTYAGQFIDFNVAIVKKAIENFCAVPFEQRAPYEQYIIINVMQIVDKVKLFING